MKNVINFLILVAITAILWIAITQSFVKKDTMGLNLDDFSQHEISVLMAAAKRNNLNPEFYSIFFAIRKVEDGDTGLEMGIKHPRCDAEMKKRPTETLDIQAGWCAATIMNKHKIYLDTGSKLEFIVFLGKKYCPIDANNDPHGLNKNWIPNMRSWIKKIES